MTDAELVIAFIEGYTKLQQEDGHDEAEDAGVGGSGAVVADRHVRANPDEATAPGEDGGSGNGGGDGSDNSADIDEAGDGEQFVSARGGGGDGSGGTVVVEAEEVPEFSVEELKERKNLGPLQRVDSIKLVKKRVRGHLPFFGGDDDDGGVGDGIAVLFCF